MTTAKVQHLLKKINYIEAEADIQKQILYSIPSHQKDEIERVLEKIADAKEQISQLRQEIKTISPDEYKKIIDIESGLAQFKEIAANKKFTALENLTSESACVIRCHDGREVSCLIKASEENGNVTVLTTEGKVVEFKKNELTAGS